MLIVKEILYFDFRCLSESSYCAVSEMNRSVWSSVLTICLIVTFKPKKIDMYMRAKRFLIFPRQAPTRHQFIAGIGIPANLDYESLTVGYVLKAEFYLPYNATVFRQSPFLPEYDLNTFLKTGKERKMYLKPTRLRWHIYAVIEYLLNGYGYNGHECLLQAICEAKRIGFSKDFSVGAELINLLLSPTSSLNSKLDVAADFIFAEEASWNDCRRYDCNIDLIDWFSHEANLKI
ncbi:uncharacterized protein LOC117890679 [Drosophila subobscura]|uniref:uncharacterized protein LOC117890679 n=1 Tax=Drosophila subobscura TaxID=7241 RepID=UPI00155A92C1|nr:uncharacterized protein LOC117890679 [Drosophila subobscura]